MIPLRLQVTASDDVDNPTSAATPTGAWQAVASRVHKARDKVGEPTKSAPAVSGPEFFGFSTTLGASLIEGLPGALSCKQYIFRDQRGKGKPRVEAGSAVEVAKQQKKRSSRSRRKSAGAKAKAPERPANLIEAVVAAVDKQQSQGDGKISLKLIRQMTEVRDHTLLPSMWCLQPLTFPPSRQSPCGEEDCCLLESAN